MTDIPTAATVQAPDEGVVVEWRLRMAAAERGIWTAAHLRRLLAERAGTDLSAASVSVLLTKQPSQLKLTTLAALCTALDCTPADLLTLHPATTDAEAPPPAPVVPLRAAGHTSVHPAGPSTPARRSLPPL